jgi:hypothetical protein
MNDFIRVTPWYESVIYALENIRPERRFLTLMFDIHCVHLLDVMDALYKEDEDNMASLPHDFLLRLMKLFR